jgi:hypothetical protein
MEHSTKIEPAAASVYTPLSQSRREIRLLKLLPGQLSDPVSCELQVVSLHDNPHYEPLSYTWGDPTISFLIYLHTVPINITINLATALRQLRKQKEPQILWVDALCINQMDNAERSHQVRLMTTIY